MSETKTMNQTKRRYRLISRRSCWILAQQYQQGLDDGRWTTQLGALSALGVSQGDLSLALQLRELPGEIFDLFDDRIGITSHTVRVIRQAILHDGLDTVLKRVQRSGACGSKHSSKAVLSIVKGKVSESIEALRWSGQDQGKIVARALDLPKNISDRYHLGVKNGEWNTFSSCARALNLSRRNISDAVAIRQLPDSIRHLFCENELTFAVGRKLLVLKDELGVEEMIARARCIEPMFKVGGRTAANILSELNEENIRPSNFTRVRIKKGRGPSRLLIECKDPELLLRYGREMELAIKKVLQKRITSAENIEFIREFNSVLRSVLPEIGRLPSTYAPRPSGSQ